jgi:ferredoxin
VKKQKAKPKYHILIDRELCVGDKLCLDKAPDVFGVDSEDKPFVKNTDTEWPENLMWLARNCPVDALTIVDAETGEKVWPKD